MTQRPPNQPNHVPGNDRADQANGFDPTASDDIVVRAVRPEEIPKTIPMLLKTRWQGESPDNAEIARFTTLSQQQGYDLACQRVVVHRGALAYCCLLVEQPGDTAFIYSAPPPAEPIVRAEAVTAVRDLLDQCRRQTVMVESLTEVDDTPRQSLCRDAGFRDMTTLLYQLRSLETRNEGPAPIASDSSDSSDCFDSFDSGDLSDSARLHWQGFSQAGEHVFRETIEATYLDSLDCPELSSIRNTDPVRSYAAGRAIEDRFWRLLRIDDQPAGVLLLSPIADGTVMELRYMGLVPEARGRKIGTRIIQHAVQQSRLARAQRLMLAVDQRNVPARSLYQQNGFTEWLKRYAQLYPTTHRVLNNSSVR